MMMENERSKLFAVCRESCFSNVFFLFLLMIVSAGWASENLPSRELMTSKGVRIESSKFLEIPEAFSKHFEYPVLSDAPIVDAVIYKNAASLMGRSYSRHTRTAPKWSHWGPGVVLPDGRVLTSLGDHGGIDGNTFIYEYDPETLIMRPVADLLSAVEGWNRGEFGFGKIHGRLSLGMDGYVYCASYWGQESGDSETLYGDRIFRYDPHNETLEDLGAPARGWGLPSTHMAPEQGLFYAETLWRRDFDQQDHKWKFLAFDVEKQEVVFMGGHEGLDYGRDFFVDDRGNAFFNNGERSLVKYDAGSSSLTDLGPVMPVSRIRRTAGPGPDGMLYATSADADDSGERVLFRFDPSNHQTEIITPIDTDTPGMDVNEDATYAYMAPRYQRNFGSDMGKPVLRTCLDDGTTKVIAFLEKALLEELGITNFPNCTFGLIVHEDIVYIQYGLANKLILVRVVPGDKK